MFSYTYAISRNQKGAVFMCSEFYTKDEVMTVLNDYKVTHLYHANTVKTACSYLAYKGLFSRQKMEVKGYPQTAQSSDRIDMKYGIYNDIFFDSCDIHNRAHNVNKYGPVLFVFSNKVIYEACHIAITRKNPIYWGNSYQLNENEHYFTNIEDLRAGFCYGNFGQSITFHNQEQVSFNTLQGIVLDCLPDDLLRQEKYKQKWDSAYCRLKYFVKQLNKQVPITLRSCDELCQCSDFYRNNYLEIDRFFDM